MELKNSILSRANAWTNYDDINQRLIDSFSDLYANTWKIKSAIFNKK